MSYVYYLSITDIIYKHLFFPSSGNRHFPSTILNSHDYPVASKSIVINSKLLESKVLFSFIIQHPCTNSLMADIGFPIGSDALYKRYKIDADGFCGKMYISYYTVYLFETGQSWKLIDILGVWFDCRFVEKLALQLFNGDSSQAAFRILSDYRKGKFGWIALERPPIWYTCAIYVVFLCKWLLVQITNDSIFIVNREFM